MSLLTDYAEAQGWSEVSQLTASNVEDYLVVNRQRKWHSFRININGHTRDLNKLSSPPQTLPAQQESGPERLPQQSFEHGLTPE